MNSCGKYCWQEKYLPPSGEPYFIASILIVELYCYVCAIESASGKRYVLKHA